AGLVLSLLQRMPRGGEIVKYGDYKLTIVDIEGKRISKVKLEKVVDNKSEAGGSQPGIREVRSKTSEVRRQT
ncbi:MAG: transporter associated domain-containing protein, partial [Nitrospira sp.]|nr:transporter associated domain-containing protein [Nitrospira sp.]